ncbi:MAG: CBS domain-containing protein [Firmicutes bacterium]|nr:CBS domain-containing protein [Bacillota bacterium]
MAKLSANTLGLRFVNAYNLLDHSLRTQYNFKANISFSDLIRRTATLNQVIRLYEDDLIDLARLRNAIIHSKSEQLIAEPHTSVVELMEKVARIISTPPLVVDAMKSIRKASDIHHADCQQYKGEVKCDAVDTISAEASLKDYIMMSATIGHSNIPVYKRDKLIGVLQRHSFLENLGHEMKKGHGVDKFLAETSIEVFIRDFADTRQHFVIVSQRVTIEEVIELFGGNRKLSAIIITSDGTSGGQLIAIVTNADIIELMKVLDSY